MDVLACDRNGCINIMCDRGSYKFGHICDDCFNELLTKPLNYRIQDFMDSPKDEGDIADIKYQVLNKEFPNRYDEEDNT